MPLGKEIVIEVQRHGRNEFGMKELLFMPYYCTHHLYHFRS
jgi:hypothetical protein